MRLSNNERESANYKVVNEHFGFIYKVVCQAQQF
jgi:hypothetical protein